MEESLAKTSRFLGARKKAELRNFGSDIANMDELNDSLMPRGMSRSSDEERVSLERARRTRLMCYSFIAVSAVVAITVGIVVGTRESSSAATTAATPQSVSWTQARSDDDQKTYSDMINTPSGYKIQQITSDDSSSSGEFITGVGHECPSSTPGQPALWIDVELIKADTMAFGTLFNTSGMPSEYSLRLTFTNPLTGEKGFMLPTSDFLWAQANLTSAQRDSTTGMVPAGLKKGFIIRYNDYVNVVHFAKGQATTFLLPWGAHEAAKQFFEWAFRTYATCASKDILAQESKLRAQWSFHGIIHGVEKWWDCGSETVKAVLSCSSAISEEGANPFEDYNCGAGAYDAVKSCICTARPDERICHWIDLPEVHE